jgi:5,6-dimethylbenzimidazole synthase
MSNSEDVTTRYAFSDEWREGVYQAIVQRRDMRSFLPNPVPQETIAKILCAANHAPSVGFMQPWNFILVEDRTLREKIQAHVEAERILAAEKFEGARREQYLTFKLEGILDSPLNICITCDPTRFGPAVIGRNTIRETDAFSTCCAVQNLWLAARAEGVGVGWVSILKPSLLQSLLNIPEHIIPVAYVCVGFVKNFPPEPLLEKVGWLPKLKLEDLVYAEHWGAKPSPELIQILQAHEKLSSTEEPTIS